ncbi:NCK-interacting protein with SH3 domain-like [Stylophora pistillata]|uniref:NCK-interacting protein with SH3 domain-like n=1 Tax=Stylophora pistillata TaxID=50429 RepID=UPI000C04373D|nr:NCK-interacting protein with SH3 domain-like [Stylophora pistillata]
MYRSIYHLVSREKGVLPIRAGDIFEFIEQHDANWWRMRAHDSSVGLVPACYLQPVETTDPGETQAVLESVDRAIEAIHLQAANFGGVYTHEQRANLRKLLEHRNRINLEVEANQPIQPRRPAPTRPPEKDKDEKKKDKDGKKKESTKRRPAPAVPTTSASTQDSAVPTPAPAVPQRTDLEPVKIRPGIAAELLELLRMKKAESRSEDEEALLQSHEGQQLIAILNELTEHKEDSQQRSWAVHDDEGILSKLLKNLLSILLDADPAVCRTVLKLDDYDYVNMLVVYFQMEERQSLRQKLIEIFGCMCGLEKEILSQLLCSVLPTELAIEIMNRKEDFPSNIVMRVLASRSTAKTLSEKIMLLINREGWSEITTMCN